MSCWEMIAKGKVQGVGFRWFVRDCAIRHCIKGYVCNLADGSVQMIAIAESTALELFADEIKQGNRHAQVSELKIDELTDYTEYEDFIIA